MEDKLFLRRLKIMLQQSGLSDCGVGISNIDDAVCLYSKRLSELIRLANILDKILVLLDETDVFLECFHAEDWNYGNNPNANSYGIQLYDLLRDTANRYQDEVDSLTESFLMLLTFYLRDAPVLVRAECFLPKISDEDIIEELYERISIKDICGKINENTTSLSSCIKEDVALFGDYIQLSLK